MYGIAQPDAFSPRATASSLLAELPGRFLPIGFLSHMKLSFVPRTPMASIVYQGRRPGVLDRGAGRGDPLDERRERIERAAQARAERLGRNRRRIDELHDYVGRQQLLALAHGQIGRGISRAQRHRLDLHRAVRRALRVDGRPDRLHPVLRGAVAFAGVLQRASRTARRVAGGRLELHRGRQRNGRGPARLEDDPARNGRMCAPPSTRPSATA